jgi:3-hydroxyisobutyrate dehydrogenase
MGRPTAANLVRAGFPVAGYDIFEAARAAAASEGIGTASSAVAAADGADVVVTMLRSGAEVVEVFTALAPSVRPGTLLIDCSTIDVESARKAHAIAMAAGSLSLDAPVSGGTGGAKAATLTFMAGGSTEAFERAGPVLSKMGKRLVHCGEAGAGQAAKICNNMILGISMIGVCEAFVLGEKLGLSHQALFDVASTSSGQCWSINSYCPVPGPVPASPANNDYKPGFASALMLKDLLLSQDAARACGAVTPLGAEATQLYALFDKLGQGAVDFSGIIKLLREQAGNSE